MPSFAAELARVVSVSSKPGRLPTDMSRLELIAGAQMEAILTVRRELSTANLQTRAVVEAIGGVANNLAVVSHQLATVINLLARGAPTDQAPPGADDGPDNPAEPSASADLAPGEVLVEDHGSPVPEGYERIYDDRNRRFVDRRVR